MADVFREDDAGQKSNPDSVGEEEETIVDDGEKNSGFPKIPLFPLFWSGVVYKRGANGDDATVLLSIISQLRPGADLSRITLPTFILEPKSMLERITKYVFEVVPAIWVVLYHVNSCVT